MAVSKIGKDIIFIPHVALGNISFDTNGDAKATRDISSSIPSGYKLAIPIFRTIGTGGAHAVTVSKASDTSVLVWYRRTVSDISYVNPSVAIICEKA